jgi:hypothetical protein
MVGIYRETIKFDVTETSIYDATFGLPWLERHEPDIAYKAKTIQFNKYYCSLKTSAVKIMPVSLAAMAVYRRQDPNLVIFALMTVPAKGETAVKILTKYRGFQHLFEEVKGKEALPEHRL